MFNKKIKIMKLTKQDVFTGVFIGVIGGVVATGIDMFLNRRKAKEKDTEMLPEEDQIAFFTIVDEMNRYGNSWKNKVSGKNITIRKISYRGGIEYSDGVMEATTARFKNFLEEFVPCEKETSL